MVYVKIDNEVVGVAFLKEVYRSTMAKALQELEKMRLKYHVMSGDSEERVRALGLEQARWGMTPEDKIQAVRRLRSDGKNVLFVGDGMNDSGAMQEANVSIAVSSAIPLTREVAGAELAEARLDLIPEAIRVSRSMCRDLRRNLFFAAGYNVVGMSLAATGVIDPVVAAVLMLSASVTVTWRALRWGEKIQARGEGA
jgi:P-type E1-E2 ATPase